MTLDSAQSAQFIKDGVMYVPPPVPSKYDIIPIHASDMGAFLRCRRYWDWSSPTRHNLRRKVAIYGINFPLWFGTGIHYALQHYYDPMLQRDPVESFRSWYKLQWEGGVITDYDLEITSDLRPTKLEGYVEGWEDYEGNLYEVKGLRDLHPDPDPEEFETHHQLGLGMMEFYRDYAKREDDFQIVAAESMFSIPLGFEAIDRREESPNYGKKLEVHNRGKRDAIWYKPALETYGIIDHKSAADIGEDYFNKLENDPQCSNYIWASVREAEINDLPWKNVEEVLYNVLRKVAPKPPTITSRGVPSIDRTKEGATAEMFETLVKENVDIAAWYEGNEKAQAYYEYLLTEGDAMFVKRDYATRNQHEIQATGERIKMVAQDMLEAKVYSHPSGDWLCTKCQFRAPCLGADDGSDYQAMLDDGYELNRDR